METESERANDTSKIERYITATKHGKGRISLEDLQRVVGTREQSRLYAAILPLLESNAIAPLKNARGNGSVTAPLYERYRILPAPIPEHDLTELHPLLLSTGYLEKHADVCHACWEQLVALSAWLSQGHHVRDVSLRERCWEVFGNEKATEETRLSACVSNASGRELRDLLLVYQDQPEDLPFTVAPAVSNPTQVLVSENRDPYLAVRRGLLAGKTQIFGVRIEAVVYGRGDVARQSGGASLSLALESMHAGAQARVLYWGDIDREGLSILASVCAKGAVSPFVPAYEAMLAAAQLHGPRLSPDKRELPFANLSTLFSAELAARLENIARDGLLLPQEVLSSRAIGEAMA